MKIIYFVFIVLAFAISSNAQAEEVCRVKVCNKLERLSLNPFSHIKDSIGKTCFEAFLPKSEAVVGKVLDSSSRWYQGSSFNPTKKSVTRVKEVYECNKNIKIEEDVE